MLKKNSHILLTILFVIINFVSAFTQTSKCVGKNGQTKRITNDKYSQVIEKGTFKCDTLVNGFVWYKDSLHKTLYVLKYENRIYKGEWDTKTKTMKKKQKNNNGTIDEDGVLKNGVLWTGKKYLYDKNGLILKVLIFQDGHFLREGQLDGF